MNKKITLLLLLVTALVTGNIKAQYWSPVGAGIGIPFGMGVVYSVALYNSELYAGGYFNQASGVPVNNIARWNGSNWSPVGQGLVYHDPDYGGVSSMAVYNGELYAAGNFDTAGGIVIKNIAKWNGANWSGLGAIVVTNPGSLVVYNGELYVAGYFPNINGSDAVIAKWDGANWTAVGTPMNMTINAIHSLVVYNGSLYAAGDSVSGGGVPVYHDIVKWNGAGWSALNSFPDGPVFCMSVYNGELYAGGYFTEAGGIPANQITKWNGANWSAVGTGINFAFDGIFHSSVNTLTVYDGALYAGGYFDSAGTVATKNIAKWDGTSWTGLGQGTDYWVSALSSDDSALYAGGWFNRVNGSIVTHKIAKWKENCSSPPPSQPGNISGNYSVCPGSSQSYSISPVIGATSYSWTLPLGWTGSSTTNSITATAGTSSGNISVSAINNCGNSAAQTVTVTVNPPLPQPGTINGNESVCLGSSQTYSISPVNGATSYTWSLPSGWMGSSTNNNITTTAGANSGLISVKAENACGSSAWRNLPVEIRFVPDQPGSIMGSNIVCVGSSASFSIADVPGAISYSWTIPSGWSGNSTTNNLTTIVGRNNGIVSVMAVNSCGNSSPENLTVLVDSIPLPPSPISGKLFVSPGETETYSVSGTGNYHWSLTGGGMIATGQNSNSVFITWKTAGIYPITVHVENHCGISSDQTLMIHVADAAGPDPFEIKLFPNPTSGMFSLNAKRTENKMIRFEILDPSGRLIYQSGQMPGTNNFSKPVHLENLPNGTYLIKVIVDGKWYSRKLIKAN